MTPRLYLGHAISSNGRTFVELIEDTCAKKIIITDSMGREMLKIV